MGYGGFALSRLRGVTLNPKPQRTTIRSTTKITLSIRPADAERIRASAEHCGLTLVAYLLALVRGETRVPFPPSHARIGNCIVSAIAESEQPTANISDAIALLREAQGLGIDFARAYLPAFEAMHSLDGAWDSPDRPERR